MMTNIKMSYSPVPIDTKTVKLPNELAGLLERLAKNTHDIWARTRFSDGWSYGRERNDARRTHPCLVPYEQLPEEEREYDRVMVSETLKAILALGYQIAEKYPREANASATEQSRLEK